MNFLDGHLFPENQEKLVITAAPYGPEWIPSDFPEDIPVTMEAQVQKVVDCYNAGARLLHLQLTNDVRTHLSRGRRRKGETWQLREARPQRRKLSIFRTKVVTPLADAVGFIDRDGAHLPTA